MRLLISILTFGLTIGAIFLFQRGNNQIPSSDFVANLAGVVEHSPAITTQPIVKKPTSRHIVDVNSDLPLIIPAVKEPAGQGPLISFSSIPAPTHAPSPLFVPAQSPVQSTPPTPTSTPATPIPTTLASTPPSASVAPTQSPLSLSPTPSPIKTNEPAISITYITSVVKQNDNAQVSIKTLADIICDISVTLPSGAKSGANELVAQTTDQNGNASWTWKINWNTKPGNAAVALSCNSAGQLIKESSQISIISR